MWLAASIGALVATLVTIFALNFTGGEKRVEKKLEHRYGVSDPQFQRDMARMIARGEFKLAGVIPPELIGLQQAKIVEDVLRELKTRKVEFVQS